MLSASQRRLVLQCCAVCVLLFAIVLGFTTRPAPQPKLYAGPLSFSALSAMAYSKALAEGYPDRVTGTPASRRAARFIERTLKSLGYRVTLQRFSVWTYGKPVIGENVIATLPSEHAAAPYVAVLAHYDNPRTTHQAAEDDGSGVGALLELARATRGRISHPIFVATDAEEIGMIGARSLVPYLKAQGHGAALSIDYVNAGAARAIQLSATGQFGGYTSIALRQIAREAAQREGANARALYGLEEWIDRTVERSFQDQGPLVEAVIPAINISSVPTDLRAARLRYHTPSDIYANFRPEAFAMVGRTAERAMRSLTGVDMAAADGFMLSPSRYVAYGALWWLLFLPLAPFIVAAACYASNIGVDAGTQGLRLPKLALPPFAAYLFIRELALHNIIPRFELYPAPPKDPMLYDPTGTAVFGMLAILVLGYALLSFSPTPLFSKGMLQLFTSALALAVFAINPFGLWFYFGIFLCASLFFVERAGGVALTVNLAVLAAALVPFALVISYFSHEIFVGPYIWWYLVLQAAYGTWSVWLVGAVIFAALLWWQYVRLAIVPFFATRLVHAATLSSIT